MKDVSQLEKECSGYFEHLQMLNDFVREQDSVYFEDFRVPEECEYLVKEIPLLIPIGRIFLRNSNIISRDDMIKAIKSERITELYKTGSLRVEYFNNIPTTWEPERFFSIDIMNTVGRILGVEDKTIYIIPTDKYYDLKLDTIKLTASMRAITSIKNPEDISSPVDVKVVTWDLTPVENKEEYAND